MVSEDTGDNRIKDNLTQTGSGRCNLFVSPII